MDNRPTTVFLDIDGTLVEHAPPGQTSHPDFRPKPLSKTVAKMMEWDAKGYNIILVTGRRESMRAVTEDQLKSLGIFYDQLVMGIGGGRRVLVNDRKPEGSDTAFAINLDRNKGIGELDI